MEKVFTTFEDLFRRSFGPSTAFFVIFAFGQLIGDHCMHQENLVGWKNFLLGGSGAKPGIGIPIAFVFLCLIGLSFILSAANRFLFDVCLKGNFTCFYVDRALVKELRRAVVDKIAFFPTLKAALDYCARADGSATDYSLYQILSNLNIINTRPHVDRANHTGIIFVSIIITVTSLIFQYLPLWYLFSIALIWFLGREAVASCYRSRAIRLYTAFLCHPDERIKAKING